MKRILYKLLLLIASFFTVLFIANQVNWMQLLKVEMITSETKEKLGDIYWEIISKNEIEITNPEITTTIDSLISKICNSSNIDKSKIKRHIISSDEVNAYALPGNHLVICSALIMETQNQQELCGVIAHEIAHMENDHVVKKLVKDVGFGLLISSTIGNSSTDVISKSIMTLTSTAYDRDMERDADITAVNYMLAANIDPLPFADFLTRIWDTENLGITGLSWVSTHPESEERKMSIINYCSEMNIINTPVISTSTWKKLQLMLAKM